MRWALNGSVAMNGREREGWEGVERLQEGSKGLSYTDEWALAGNHRVASLSIMHLSMSLPTPPPPGDSRELTVAGKFYIAN